MNKKQVSLIAFGGMMTLLLSGCQKIVPTAQDPAHAHPHGIVYHYLGVPMMHIMNWLAGFLGHNYGWALVALVIIVRLILLPIMINQMKRSTMMQEKMNMIQPQMREIQKRTKEAKTPEEQAAASQAMMQLYRENNISMTGGIGCLPLLIQLPVFTGLYDAIRYSPQLYHATFMGIPLGKPSALMAFLSFGIYLLQAWLSMIGVPESQKRQMFAAMIMSPVMILFISLSASAGLGIYFFIGGLFAVIQTLAINAYRPRMRKRLDKQMKEHPIKKVELPPVRQDDNSHQSTVEQLRRTDSSHPTPHNTGKGNSDLRRLNAGKQHHKK